MEEKIDETITLTTRQHWKAISHPLRLAILDALVTAAQTNEELARALKTPSGQLHYHTTLLLKAGLIRQVGTRQRGHLTEKLYRAVARQWVGASPSSGGDTPPLAPAIQAGLELYRSSWESERGALSQLGYHLVLAHSDETITAFSKKLRALFDEFQVPTATTESEGRAVALTVLFHALPEGERE